MAGQVELRQAPYPADTRAKGWRFELDHERIRQSDTWALTPADIRPWLLMLWMVAWEQTPCGSMPDSDELICARIGMQPKAFAKAKAVLMRGWWKAEDGRLYHSVIAERVVEMLDRRRKEAERKRGQRGVPKDSPESPDPVPRDTTVTDGTGTGTGTSTGKKEKTTGRAHAPRLALPSDFLPNEEGVRAARDAGLNLDREVEAFRNWHAAQGSTMANWQAAWRTWVGKAVDYGRGGKTVPPTQSDWAKKAGFETVYEAQNAGCYSRNAHEFRDGKRIKEAA